MMLLVKIHKKNMVSTLNPWYRNASYSTTVWWDKKKESSSFRKVWYQNSILSTNTAPRKWKVLEKLWGKIQTHLGDQWSDVFFCVLNK